MLKAFCITYYGHRLLLYFFAPMQTPFISSGLLVCLVQLGVGNKSHPTSPCQDDFITS